MEKNDNNLQAPSSTGESPAAQVVSSPSINPILTAEASSGVLANAESLQPAQNRMDTSDNEGISFLAGRYCKTQNSMIVNGKQNFMKN